MLVDVFGAGAGVFLLLDGVSVSESVSADLRGGGADGDFCAGVYAGAERAGAGGGESAGGGNDDVVDSGVGRDHPAGGGSAVADRIFGPCDGEQRVDRVDAGDHVAVLRDGVRGGVMGGDRDGA